MTRKKPIQKSRQPAKTVSKGTDWNQLIHSIDRNISARPGLYALIINILLFLYLYASYTFRFQTSDDVAMLLKASGTSWIDEPTAHLFFSNVIIGWVLKTLYTTLPNIPWYGLYLIGGMFAFCQVLAYQVLKKVKAPLSIIYYLAFFFMLAMNVTLNLQFTIVSWCLAFAGLMLLAGNFKKINEMGWLQALKSKEVIAGLILVLISAMIRWPSMLLSALIFLPLFLIQTDFRNLRKQIQPYFIIGGLIVACFAVNAFSKWSYGLEPARKAHQQFVPVINQFIDYGVLHKIPMEERSPILQSVGWTENDYRILMSWFYMNDTLYSVENANRILAQVPAVKTGSDPNKVFRQISKYSQRKFAINAFILLALGLLIGGVSRNKLLGTVSVALLSVLMIFYLFYFKKPPPPRVFFSFFMLLALVPIILYQHLGHKGNIKLLQIVGILAVFAIIGYQFNSTIGNYRENSDNIKSYNEWLHNEMLIINPQPNDLYMVWTSGFPWEFVLPLEKLDYLKNFNSCNTMGGYLTRSKLKKMNIQDPYRELMNREDMVLVTRATDEKLNYIMFNNYAIEHYGKSVLVSPVRQNRFFSVARFREGAAARP